jgi:hypothetical protein
MSVFDENIQPLNPDHQVDLLVDGELSETDRRELLLRLEREPGGWRRCALAFLEAQCWKSTLGQVAPSSPEPCQAAVQPARVPVNSSRRGGWQNWRQFTATLLSISASFLLALVVGMGLTGKWSDGSRHSPDSSQVTGARAPLDKSEANGWEMVTLTSDKSSDGQAATYHVPAQRRDVLDQNMLEQLPDAIPPDVQQAFEESGHRLVQQREIVSGQMKDGRRLVVPVDHIQVHYVGRRSL